MTDAQSIFRQRQDMFDHPMGDHRCDKVEIGCITAQLSDHVSMVKAQLVSIDACDPMLSEHREHGFRRRAPGNDSRDQRK